MGQGDIYNYLKEHRGKRFDTKQLSKILKVNQSSISTAINRLLKTNAYGIKRTWIKSINSKHKKMVVWIR